MRRGKEEERSKEREEGGSEEDEGRSKEGEEGGNINKQGSTCIPSIINSQCSPPLETRSQSN